MSQEAKLKAGIIGLILSGAIPVAGWIWLAAGTVKDVEANTDFRQKMEPKVERVIQLDIQMQQVQGQVADVQEDMRGVKEQMSRIERKIDRLQ